MSKAGALALFRSGGGRGLPLILLATALLALFHIEATPLANLRAVHFDRYQQQMPRNREDEPVIVVGIDSQSLATHGQWPWSRDLIAGLVRHVLAGKPLAVGVDIVFAEKDRHSPEILVERLPAIPRSALLALPDPDRTLASALGSGPTALAIVGLDNVLPGSKQPSRPLPIFGVADDLERALPSFPSALASRDMLETAASGEGLINASPDRYRSNAEGGVLRRVPSIGLVEHQPFLSLPLEMVRLALGRDAVVVAEPSTQGMQAIRIGDYRLPTQPNGELLLHFGRASSNYYLSAADVLAGVHPPEMFASRFVIIGFNSTGLQDRIITPLGESLPGIDIHAQVIESLLSGIALQRPFWMATVELGVLALAGLLLIAGTPVVRPSLAIAGFMAFATLIVGAGYWAFHLGRWLFDGLSIALLLVPVFASLIVNRLVAADAERRRTREQLRVSREDAARVEGELNAARRIQMGLLPDPAALFASEKRFEVAALLESARAVGGDFYDCQMLDERRLCLAVGDVSGKGVPASLFMAIAKTLTGTATRRESDLAQAMREIETELARENPEGLFVTAFVAVIDVDSGVMTYACAGHDAPVLVRAGSCLRIDTTCIGGPPLCALGDYPYAVASLQLEPGDLLCLFTDGLTEASDGSSQLGERGLRAVLAQAADDNLQALADQLRDQVRHFEAGIPPADDLTLLLFRWQGPISAG